MKLGIVGLPNVGKSTLFNAITNAGAESANYPFCTISPNIGVVPVPDERLTRLAEMYSPEKITPAIVEFVDIAGLVKGASKGEGLGNQFLANIREVDAIVHVVRCFDDENIVHVEGGVDPLRDIEVINIELALADLDILERRIDKAKKLAKGDKRYAVETELFERLAALLSEGTGARAFMAELSEEERGIVESASMLSLKPVVYAANLSEKDFSEGFDDNIMYKSVAEFARREGSEILPICAKAEQDISELDEEEKALFLEDLGLRESGLDRLIRTCYHLLGLISYLTAGPKEVRAWTIRRGAKAPEAAGKIHSDFEKGFIRAEIVAYDDLTNCGSMATAKEKGLVKSEGKEYVVRDGDVVLFRFNV